MHLPQTPTHTHTYHTTPTYIFAYMHTNTEILNFGNERKSRHSYFTNANGDVYCRNILQLVAKTICMWRWQRRSGAGADIAAMVGAVVCHVEIDGSMLVANVYSFYLHCICIYSFFHRKQLQINCTSPEPPHRFAGNKVTQLIV